MQVDWSRRRTGQYKCRCGVSQSCVTVNAVKPAVPPSPRSTHAVVDPVLDVVLPVPCPIACGCACRVLCTCLTRHTPCPVSRCRRNSPACCCTRLGSPRSCAGVTTVDRRPPRKRRTVWTHFGRTCSVLASRVRRHGCSHRHSWCWLVLIVAATAAAAVVAAPASCFCHRCCSFVRSPPCRCMGFVPPLPLPLLTP